jgi:hypothetical protein
MRALIAGITGRAIVLFARFITAVRAIWAGVGAGPVQRVYFANHTSNGDFILPVVGAAAPPARGGRGPSRRSTTG